MGHANVCIYIYVLYIGIPINGETSAGLTKKIVWDTMRTLATQRKKKLIFSATSSAFHRLQIMDCISRKVARTLLQLASHDATINFLMSCESLAVFSVGFGGHQVRRAAPRAAGVGAVLPQVGIGHGGAGYAGSWLRHLQVDRGPSFCTPYINPTHHGCRLWETMTMGTMAVLEKGVGLDKPVRCEMFMLCMVR